MRINRISATNNSRRYNNTTYYDSNNSHVQRFDLDDGNQSLDDGVYAIDFTDEEFSSKETFCRGISKIIRIFGSLFGKCPWSYSFYLVFHPFQLFFYDMFTDDVTITRLDDIFDSEVNPNLLKSLTG